MFRSIECSLWDDPKVRSLTPPAKLLFLYSVTNRHAHVSGAYVLPDLYAGHETGLAPAALAKAWGELVDGRLAVRDGDVVWIRHMYRYQGRGPKLDAAAAKNLQTLHRSGVVRAFVDLYPQVADHLPAAFLATVATLPYPPGYGEAADTLSAPPNTPSAPPAPAPAPRRTKTATDAAEFESFWRAYPRKIGKPRAMAAWSAAKDRPAIDVVLAALDRLRASRDWTEEGGRYIPHPTTWIHRAGWGDEVAVALPPATAPTPVARVYSPRPGMVHPHDAGRVWDGSGYLTRERWDAATTVWVDGVELPRAEWEATR